MHASHVIRVVTRGHHEFIFPISPAVKHILVRHYTHNKVSLLALMHSFSLVVHCGIGE